MSKYIYRILVVFALLMLFVVVGCEDITGNTEITYEVVFDSNGGSDVKTRIVKENKVVNRPFDPEREGYKFLYWELNGEPYDFKTIVEEDLVLIAKWEILPSSNLKFELNPDGNSYQLINGKSCRDSNVIIPSTYKGLPVTKIGYSAFELSKTVVTVSIPDTVTQIKSSAFESCEKLTTIEIPDSVTSIEHKAFYECINLASVKLPKGITSIEGYTFYGCKKLTSVSIPNNVTAIRDSAFAYCNSLSNIDIPNSVTDIDILAFYNCTSLTSIEIPNSVTSIGVNVFLGCTSLSSLVVNENNQYYKSIDNNLYSKDGKTLIYYNIANNDLEFVIPSTVTTLARSAFKGCENLVIIIPSSVINVEASAVVDCNNITIYCEAESKPSGWSDYWNQTKCTEIWGYKK